MPFIQTADLRQNSALNPDHTSWVYNGLDCCLTAEIHEVLTAEINQSPPNVRATYEFSLAKQAPYLEMSLRGIRVDELARQSSIDKLQAVLSSLETKFDRLMQGAFDHGLNYRSPTQLKTFFYGELGLKEIKRRNAKGIYVATVDEDALKQLQMHFYAQIFSRFILAMRDLAKKITSLKTEIDPDGRMRCKINVVGTKTGRLSSSTSDFGTGTNLQNVDSALRAPFIADPKMVLLECDLEQADSRNLGAVLWTRYFHSHGAEAAGKYLDACESGDLHTSVAHMCFPTLPWPEDPKDWRPVAEGSFDGPVTYRQSCKVLGHGSNYYGKPPTMSKHTAIPKNLVEDFQRAYFRAFPLIPQWHEDVIQQIKTSGEMTTLFGRRRHFFGRGFDQDTWREAIAYEPQSMTGEEMDRGVVNLWRNYPAAELLMQVHDSILFQVPWHNHQTHAERALALLRYEVTLVGNRPFCVPLGAKIGWNWGKAGKSGTNPFGLRDWRGVPDDRTPPVHKRIKDYF